MRKSRLNKLKPESLTDFEQIKIFLLLFYYFSQYFDLYINILYSKTMYNK